MVDTVRVYQIGGEVLYEPPQHVQLQQTCALVLYESAIGAARVRVGQAGGDGALRDRAAHAQPAAADDGSETLTEGPVTPEEHTQAIGDLREGLTAIATHVAEIKGTLNNGLKMMVAEHKVQLTTIEGEVATINQAVTSHIAKEDLLFEIFKRTLNTGVAITGGLIALLVSIIGYLLVHPIGLH